MVFKFDVTGLNKFEQDVRNVQELACKISDTWPGDLPESLEPDCGAVALTRDISGNSTDCLNRRFQTSLKLDSCDITSVWRVLVLRPGGEVVACGSAVCVDAHRKLMLTAAHVVCG